MFFNVFFFLLPVDIGLSAVLEPDFQIVIKIFVSDCNNVFIWLCCLSLFFFPIFFFNVFVSACFSPRILSEWALVAESVVTISQESRHCVGPKSLLPCQCLSCLYFICLCVLLSLLCPCHNFSFSFSFLTD